MSDILDQIAGIKVLLQEQAEDCAQQMKYEQERREIADKRRAETDAIEAAVRENLERIARTREEILSADAGHGGQPAERELNFGRTKPCFDLRGNCSRRFIGSYQRGSRQSDGSDTGIR
ncbi:hypothetical protein B0H17DRAFT_424151 [Mycena rosella]|uniref:Uncharacterized protein n=1 Tax=Mycena rosella TaxID=1033263 RepID=A0AAD7DNG7_MYCRO|nr:hypothetical protein B0H17DRAFT_424151 [Mycena rosella]